LRVSRSGLRPNIILPEFGQLSLSEVDVGGKTGRACALNQAQKGSALCGTSATPDDNDDAVMRLALR
jgi:hypothetical protein